MKGPGIFTLLMLMTLVLSAYAVISPHASARENGGLFGRSSASKYSCPLGSHYSSFYGECTRTVMRVSH
jgi:hypothetical protein